MKQNCYNLRPLWDVLIDMYEEIKILCDRHGIRHWAVAGTALGAMRHQGFIPWDDDFDIAMMRPDYERFLIVAQKELPNHLVWSSVETNPEHKLSFGKVYNISPGLRERLKHETRLDLNDGVFVDVFPIDGQPSTRLGLLIFKVIRGTLRRTIRFIPVSAQKRRLIYQGFLKSIPIDYGDMCGVADQDSHKSTAFYWNREWFATTKSMRFDALEVPLPGARAEFLSRSYRNWHQLPPERNRVPSHQGLPGGIIDF